MAIDERLRRELERAARPADPSGVYEDLIRRREWRQIARRVQAGGLALAVFAATVGGFFALTRLGRDAEPGPDIATPTPSNGLIVFSLTLDGEGEQLFAVAPDGSALRRLTPEGRADYRSPDVSPDGRTVVVVHEIPSFEPAQAVLATVPVEGGSPTWLHEEPWHVLDPTWSPDGSRIAFAGSVPGTPFGIYVVDVTTGEARLVPGTDEISVGHPTWSPDGTHIAFEASTDNENWDIHSVRLDGSAPTILMDTPGAREIMPAWSWANDRIAFVRRVDGAWGLYTMAADGTDELLVNDEFPYPHAPAWSPDGSMLAFAEDTGQVWTIRPDGSGLRPVSGALGDPSWQALPEDVSIAPTPSPTPGPSGRDIGLGFPVCNVSSIEAPFVEAGADATAFVATRRGDTGGCPDPQGGFNVVALDADADGLADTSYGPIECELECRTFSAPDVDGDGTAELLVVQGGGSVLLLGLFDVDPDTISDAGAPGIVGVTVARPGDPDAGLVPGERARFLLGGDEFFLYTLRCGDPDVRGGPGIVYTTAESLPHDSPDARWHAHTVHLILNNGLLAVADVGDFTEPATADPPSFQSGETLCGSNLGP